MSLHLGEHLDEREPKRLRTDTETDLDLEKWRAHFSIPIYIQKSEVVPISPAVQQIGPAALP
jgi:hypothetical protein